MDEKSVVFYGWIPHMDTANGVDIYSIYIYIYVCVCVCVFLKQTTFIQSNKTYVLF